jgi:hypothetical protein
MPTINVNFNLSESVNSVFHIEKIKFAQSLLDYYNNKLNLQISLDYTEDFKFKHTKYSNDDLSCASFVENNTFWSIQDRSVDEKWLYSFISVKRNIADNIKSPFYASIALSSLTQADVDFFLFQKDKFKSIHKDLDCLSFLSLENKTILKTALNNICDELDEVA